MKGKPFLFTAVIITFSFLLFISCENGAGTGSGADTSDLDDTPPVGTVINVNNADQWTNALSTINSGGNNKSYTINVLNDFSLPGSPVYSFNSTGIAVLIKGNKKITLTSPGSILVLKAGQAVIVENTIFKGFAGNNSSVVEVMAGGYGTGTFTMQGNASIQDNITPSFGAGVNVFLGGTFIMKDNASVSGNASSNYGGGGVYVRSGGSFVMKDNTSVSDNTASYGGGGVYVTGTFTMQDGASVSGNTASLGGGGVYVASTGSFIMEGSSSISGNIETGSGTYAGGGGVYIDTNGSFTMNDSAMVLGNTASSSGGGVLVYGISNTTGGTFRISGGTVYGNEVVAGLKNVAANGASLYRTGGTAQYGITSPYGSLNTSENTIKVVNGLLE